MSTETSNPANGSPWDVPGWQGGHGEEPSRADESEWRGAGRWAFRQVVIRLVALLLLVSLLASVFLALRGIEHIAIVVGLLAAVALIAAWTKRQREAESPYASDDAWDEELS